MPSFLPLLRMHNRRDEWKMKTEMRKEKERTQEELERILQKYPLINKYYGSYVATLINKGHPVVNLIINERSYLDLLNGWLEKLDCHPGIAHLVKKSKNPADFFNTMSELKVASFLIDKVQKGNLTIIVPDNSSPDFKIEISGKTITIEVKNIEDKRITGKGNIKYNPDCRVLDYEFEDTQTIYNHIKESIIEKHQYYQNIPHIIVFDCESPLSATSIRESEFESVLYAKKDKKGEVEFKPVYSITKKSLGLFAPKSEYDGVFFKENRRGKIIYSCLSGVAAFLSDYHTKDFESKSWTHHNRRIVFFRNPNADLNVEEDILSSLGMEIHEIKE